MSMTTIRRQVVFIKSKTRGKKRTIPKPKAPEPSHRMEDGQERVRVSPTKHALAQTTKPWWRMAWIPLLVIAVLTISLSLAGSLGDSLRNQNKPSPANEQTAKAYAGSRNDQYPMHHSSMPPGGLGARTTPTDESFRATPYGRRSGPHKKVEQQTKPGRSCDVSADPSSITNRLSDCLNGKS